MASNFLSNVGLVSQGMRSAELDREKIAQMKQQTAAGDIGLSDLTRASQAQAAQRTAVQGAEQNMRAMSAAQADAAWKAGDAASAQKHMQDAIGMEQRAEDVVIEHALRGSDTNRIDADVERMVGANVLYDRGSLRIENRGGRIILHATKNGRPLPEIDAMAEYEKKQKPVTLNAGQVMINPATGKPVASNIQPEAAASGLGDTYWKTGERAGQIITKGGPRTTVSISKTEGGVSAQKNLPMFNALAKSLISYPGMGSIDDFGNATLTPEGNVRASIANQLVQSNPNIDPATVVKIVMNGKPKIDPRTGEKFIEYKGKIYQYSNSMQQQQEVTTTSRNTTSGGVNELPEDQGGATGEFSRGGKVNHKGMC